MNSYDQHCSVLLEESVAALNIKPDGIYVDCTLGRAGHSQKILAQLNSAGRLIGIDRDQTAIDYANQVIQDPRFTAVHAPFSQLKQILAQHNIEAVDGCLFDLGVSSPQLDDPHRGFSYHQDARLDMRMDQSQSLDAHEIVNHYSLTQLKDIFQAYGAGKFSVPVARAIVKHRAVQPIDTTLQLVEVIKSALPKAQLYGDKHPARVYFQALRIAVNHEFEEIQQALHDALTLLANHGRLVVISFHSLENAIVKHQIKQTTQSKLPSYLPCTTSPTYKIIKPPVVSNQELANNHRARSAKLHIMERNENVK